MAVDLVDRISDLPDTILGVILSNLPTKNAVATSILSKRWKFIWTTVHNLDFCSESITVDDVYYINFLQSVNRILLLHGCRLLIKFRFYWQPLFITSFDVHSLMMNPRNIIRINNNVHELLLLFNPDLGRMPQPLEMPINLFTCESLQSLELDSNIYVSAAIVVSLPRLETLKLVSIYFQSEETLNKLISGCPMLKNLHIDCGFTRNFGEDDDNIAYRISSSSLTHLTIFDHHLYLEVTRSLELEASSLEYLELVGPITLFYVQGSLSSLVEAGLDIELQDLYDYNEAYYNLLAEGVCSFHCVKTLSLSSELMSALSIATMPLSTKFTRLTKLEAQVVCCYCSSLMDFIQNSDSLQVLKILKRAGDHDEDYNNDHSNWNPLDDVPECLSNTLKEVSFECYTGYNYDDAMIGYLLKHGSVLEVMQVTCDEDCCELAGEKDELVENICRLQRKSPACRVEFI